jgi:hypothetical protein
MLRTQDIGQYLPGGDMARIQGVYPVVTPARFNRQTFTSKEK